jgi:hypothetical protein
MFIFAKNAIELPPSPDEYKEGIAYLLPYNDAYLDSGIASMSLIESAMLNKYLLDLTTTIKKYLDMGLSYEDFPAFVPENPEEGDIRRDPENICSFMIYLSGAWGPLTYEATKEANGYIDLGKCFQGNILDSIPESTSSVAGKIRVGDCVLVDDFIKLASSQLISSDGGDSVDVNEAGDSYYFSSTQLNVSFDPVASPFFVKKVFGEDTVQLNINGNTFKMSDFDNSAFVFSDGTVCG